MLEIRKQRYSRYSYDDMKRRKIELRRVKAAGGHAQHIRSLIIILPRRMSSKMDLDGDYVTSELQQLLLSSKSGLPKLCPVIKKVASDKEDV
jgi:hypothetical protein